MPMRRYDPDLHHRRSVRLRGYDYGQAGVYFLTICAVQRMCLFGEIVDNVLWLSHEGRIVEE
jgi:putative transposase